MDAPYTSFFASSVVASTQAGAVADVIYTVPAKFDAEVTLLVCTNGAAADKINIQVYREDGTAYHYLLRAHSVGANDSYNAITSNRLFLHSGDKIVAYKVGGTFDVSVSGKQYFNAVRNV
tara:strand:+ start:94 stop:453 length:360 start_codon:yes stop_codon:yes gene_type:complete